MMNQPGRRKVLAPGTGMVFIKQIVQIQMLIRAVTGYLVGKYDTFVYPVPVSCRIMELASRIPEVRKMYLYIQLDRYLCSKEQVFRYKRAKTRDRYLKNGFFSCLL